jgi:hypothetical protein
MSSCPVKTAAMLHTELPVTIYSAPRIESADICALSVIQQGEIAHVGRHESIAPD